MIRFCRFIIAAALCCSYMLFLFYCALPDTYQRLKAAGLYQWDGSVSTEIFSSLTQVWKNSLLMIDFPHKGIFSYTYLSVQIAAPKWNDSLCLTAALCMDELAHFSKNMPVKEGGLIWWEVKSLCMEKALGAREYKKLTLSAPGYQPVHTVYHEKLLPVISRL